MTARRLAAILLEMWWGYSRLASADEADERPTARHCPHVWYWHFSDVTARADDVSPLGESRHCGCEYLRSDFDPRVRPLQPWGGGWSNLWSLSAQDRWSSFARKNSSFFKTKNPLRWSKATTYDRRTWLAVVQRPHHSNSRVTGYWQRHMVLSVFDGSCPNLNRAVS
jgi:hypothetical protein